MADNKENVGEPDRSRVSGSQAYEVHHFAKAHGLSVDQARKLIRKHGKDRETLNREARKLSRH